MSSEHTAALSNLSDKLARVKADTAQAESRAREVHKKEQERRQLGEDLAIAAGLDPNNGSATQQILELYDTSRELSTSQWDAKRQLRRSGSDEVNIKELLGEFRDARSALISSPEGAVASLVADFDLAIESADHSGRGVKSGRLVGLGNRAAELGAFKIIPDEDARSRGAALRENPGQLSGEALRRPLRVSHRPSGSRENVRVNYISGWYAKSEQPEDDTRSDDEREADEREFLANVKLASMCYKRFSRLIRKGARAEKARTQELKELLSGLDEALTFEDAVDRVMESDPGDVIKVLMHIENWTYGDGRTTRGDMVAEIRFVVDEEDHEQGITQIRLTAYYGRSNRDLPRTIEVRGLSEWIDFGPGFSSLAPADSEKSFDKKQYGAARAFLHQSLIKSDTEIDA